MKNILKRAWAIVLAAGIVSSVQFAVRAEETETFKNVALGKTTSSTGIYAPNFADKYAVDGDVNTSWASGQQEPENKYVCQEGENATIVVDLEENHMISEIYVRTRRDMDQSYTRRNWLVYASDTADFKNQKLVGEKKLSGVFKEDLEIRFQSLQKMRYIKVTCSTPKDGIVISEIEAYGYAIGNEETGFANYSDMEASRASYLLSQLGIIPQATTFNPLMLVTRAEAAADMLKLLNFKADSGKKYFTDVSENDEYFNEISSCCELGIIMQSDSFRPNDFVTRIEYLTMALRTIGYNHAFRPELGELNVERSAERLDLYKNTDFSGGEYVNKENAMWIMYNTLMCEPLKFQPEQNSNSKTLLEYSYKIKLKNGIVTANNESNLDAVQAKKKSYIEVDNVPYEDESGIIYKYLGKNIKFAVDSSDETNIKFAFVDFERNNVKIINGNDIKNVTKSVVTFYTENGRTRSVNISGAKILKNNAAFTNYRNETEYFKRPNGYLELTDNNRDGKYDVVNIMEPTIIEVENVSVGDGLKVVDKSGNDYDFSKCDHISITMDGRSSTEKGMTSANFLLMYISPENINVSIDSISSTISGKITGVGEDSVSIDGKEYTLADYFKNDSGFVKRLIVGCEETFYYSGNVIYALSEKTFQSENINIGFVLRAGYDQYKQQVELRVYTSDGIFRDLYLNRSVMIDGTKWSLDEILQDYKYFNKKFMLFKMTGDGRITWVDTETMGAGESASYMSSIAHTSNDEWRATSDGVWAKYKMIVPVKNTMPVFMIPWADNTYDTSSGSEGYYDVSEFSKLYNYNGKPISSNVTFYKADDTEFASFACAPKTVPTNIGKYSSSNDANTPIVILSSMGIGISGDEDILRQITCVDISTGTETEYFLPNDLQYAIKAPEIINDGLSTLYNKSDNTIKRSVTIPDEYLVDFDDLKRGDILRVQSYGNSIIGFEVMEQSRGVDEKIYCGSNGLGGIWSGILTMNAEIEDISDGRLKYNNGEGPAWKDYGEFVNCFVVGDRAIEKVKTAEVAQHFKSEDKVFMLFKNGKAVSLVKWD